MKKDAVHYNWKCLDDIYSSLIGRFFEYKNVYFHKTSRAADITIHEMLKEACDPLNLIERTNDFSKYTYLNEYTLIGEIFSSKSEDLAKARDLVKDLFNRRLYKSVWERIIDESNLLKYNMKDTYNGCTLGCTMDDSLKCRIFRIIFVIAVFISWFIITPILIAITYFIPTMLKLKPQCKD